MEWSSGVLSWGRAKRGFELGEEPGSVALDEVSDGGAAAAAFGSAPGLEAGEVGLAAVFLDLTRDDGGLLQKGLDVRADGGGLGEVGCELDLGGLRLPGCEGLGFQHLFDGGEGLFTEQGSLQEVECAGVQRVEGGSEVAAIDRRDGERGDGFEGFDVVPVVDVAALLFELVVGGQGSEGGLGELGQGEEAELVRGLPGVEKHAEVGGGELADLVQALLFDVVGDEPVIFFVAEVEEVAPDVESLLLQESSVGCGERAFGSARRRVEPDDDEGRDDPEQKDGACGDERGKIGEAEGEPDDNGDDGRELKVDVERGGFSCAGFRLGGGLPFEEVLAGYEAANQGADDCVHREKHLVGEEGEGEDREAERGGKGGEAFLRADEAELQRGAAEVEGELNEDREQQKEERCDGPVERTAGENEPAEDEHDEGDGLDEAAAEVVEDLPAEMVLMGLETNLPVSSGTRPKSHCAICQSPRTQRCLRRVWAE